MKKKKVALTSRLGFRLGQVDYYHSHPLSMRLSRLRKVANEAHRLAGLVRFSVLRANSKEGEVLCQDRTGPRYIGTAGEHFSDRFKGDPFLFTMQRSKALYSAAGQWRIAYR